ncbi:hypothetical protein Fmac_006642 [Flemingia macrophylla]|uniref:Defensin-like protein n=1 Tax=Flemingia macrophylla TaxID=520843 RepID=A0ABD1NB57_9FABA
MCIIYFFLFISLRYSKSENSLATVQFPRAAGLASDFVVRGRAHGVKIPEHWCHKLIHLSNCELQKCFQECSKEPYGIGECKDSSCFCTYYCKDPPL